MPGFDGTEELDKLLEKAPAPPGGRRGKVKRGHHSKVWTAYVDRRTAWVEEVLAAGGDLVVAAKALRKVGHPITRDGLQSRRAARGLSATRRPKPGKILRAEVADVAKLIADLVDRQCAPLHSEIARLRKVEKRYLALGKLLSEDKPQ